MVDMDFNPPGTKIRISRAKLVKIMPVYTIQEE